MHLLEEELDRVQKEWNTHRVRKNHLAQAPAGIPNFLYDCPDLSGALSVVSVPVRVSNMACVFHRLKELYVRC